jgi:two-component system, sensor histidine kinase and response regulator
MKEFSEFNTIDNATLDSLMEGFQLVGFDWRYLYVNKSIVEQSKLKSVKDLLGFTMMEKFPGIENTELFRVLKECMKNRVFKTMENKFTFPDGSVGWFELRIEPVPKGIFVLSIDITKRKEIEKEITKYNKELKEINEATEKIISVISHDLKNPVAGIISTSGILKNSVESFEKEHIVKFSDIIHRASSKLLDRLNELISWVKSMQEKVNFHPQSECLYVAVNNALDSMMLNASQKNIKIENKIPEDIFVFADVNMLKSIVQNLVSNSIKFTPKGGEIEISCSIKNSMAEICVMDNGVGMSKKIMDNLLNKKHITTSGTDNEEGTGLGLRLIEDFIAQNGGEIFYKSEENKGTTVVFTIPLGQKK